MRPNNKPRLLGTAKIATAIEATGKYSNRKCNPV